MQITDTANAATYEVGAGKAYANLEALREAAANSEIAWNNDDEIIVTGDDNSLTAAFNFGGKTIKIISDGTILPNGSGFLFANNNNGNVIFAAGSRFTLDGFSNSSGNGGAIYAYGGIEINGNSTFSGNTGKHGGAIYAYDYYGTGGGVKIDGTSVFSNNTATDNGGAIYNFYSNVTIGDNSTFSGNNAGNLGGAIFANYGNVEIDGISVFSGNTADTSGGAIYAHSGGVTISGASTFSGNTASNTSGGAIYAGGDVTLNATSGNIIFIGNTAHSTPNAIYLNNTDDDKTLSLSATAGNSILFYDPIESRNSLGGGIKINENNQTGTILFDTHQSKIYGDTTVSYGTLALTNGATYGADSNSGDFTLNTNATLFVAGSGNAIKTTGTVTLGGTLAFDLTGIEDGNSETLLTFNGTTSGTEISKVDIRAFNGSGTFNLATTSSTFTLSGTPTLTMHGEALTDTRAKEKVEIDLVSDGGTDNVLQLTSSVTNGTVTWTGNAGNNIWNATSDNWQGSDTISSATKFLHGDDVVFDSAGEVITIQGGGVTVNGMEVKQGVWTFTGGEIDGNVIDITGDSELYFDTRKMNQRITVADGVTATIAATDGETLTFAGFNASGVGGAADAYYGGNLTIGSANGSVVFLNNSAEYGGAIYANSDVTISGNSTFSGNKATAIGGAIYAYNDVIISGTSTFSGNKADYDGGAIYAYNDVIISGTSTFSGNEAVYGGAIQARGDVNISDTSTFSGNKADSSGGAIFARFGDVTISGDSMFSGNNADYGGAIYAPGNVEISGTSTFSGNKADYSGGAIYAYDDVIISGTSTFSGNTTDNYGGAIYVFGGDVTISGTSKFSNNETTNGYGGAIAARTSYNYGEYYGGDVTISGNSTFSGNKAAVHGGAIYANDNVTISGDSTFSGNKATEYGGAIFAEFGDVTISDNSMFSGNEAEYGGAIFASGGDVTISGTSTFSGNKATVHGGAIYANDNVTISGDSTFSGNKATEYGGAIFAEFGDVTISDNSMFSVNEAEYGGAIFASGGDVTISGTSTFQNNTATSNDGGAIYANKDVTISGTSTFSGNKADYFGGAIYADDVIISDTSTFSGNTTDYYGGAIYAVGNVEISGTSTFSGNNADYSGGAIFAVGNVEISGTSTFSDNTTTDSYNSLGGAIYADGDVTISGTSTFQNNTATSNDGGAIYATNVTIDGNSTFSGNKAAEYGGAIYAYSHYDFDDEEYYGGDVTISGTSKFLNNEATTETYSSGGAINATNVTIDGNSTFSGNKADYFGGAIYANKDVTISGNSTFSGNKAQYGGAIYADGNVTISDNSMFSGNEAEFGGAIFAAGGDVTISGTSKFSNNEATNGSGGAIYASVDGGHGSDVTIDGISEFSNNKATSRGGAIYANGIDLTISGTSTFSNNETTNGSGGAIHADGNVTLNATTGNITFSGNKQNTNDPNAIYLYNDGNNKTLSLSATNGNSILFYDPIESSSSNTYLTIKINENSNQTGTVLFDGTNGQSNIYGNTTVFNGTLAMTNGAKYGANGNNGTFTLEKDATLSVKGNGNEINAGDRNVTLKGTLAFDLTGYSAGNTLLTINSSSNTSGTPSIDIRNVATNGKYILLAGTDLTGLTVPNTFYFGESVENTRAKNISLIQDTTDQLILKFDTTNYDVTWKGTHNGFWNINDRNWSGTDNDNDPITQFLHNDNVTFDSTGIAKSVVVNSDGVNVVTMNVTGTGYIFSNGKINGTTLNLNSSGETTFKNEMNFTNGITVAQNSTLVFDYTTDIANSNKISGDGAVKKIGNGSLVLTGDTSSATGTFWQNVGDVTLQNAWGGSYNQSANTILNLGSTARIGGNADLAGTVNFSNELNVGGNLTYKNTSNPLDLTGAKKLVVGGDFTLANDSSMNFEIAGGKLTAGSVNLEGDVEVLFNESGTIQNVITQSTAFNDTQKERLDDIFTVSKLLTDAKPDYSTDNKTMNVTVTTKAAEDFMTQNESRSNQNQIASLLDELAKRESSVNYVLRNIETQQELEALVVSLLTPELAADARDIPLTHPYYRVFNHVNNLLTTSSSSRNLGGSNLPDVNTIYRGQNSFCSNSARSEIWFEGYYRTENVYSDSNALGYKTSHGGMVVGIDEIFANGLVTGVIFGYGNPRSYNKTGKIEADDYTFGLYSRLKIAHLYANIFLGYGHQNYNLNNSVKYNGNSLYTSFEIFDRINLHSGIVFMPLVGLDFQKSWSDGFSFNSNFGQISVGKGELEQMVLRVGVNSTYKNLRTRLQYGYQVAGDTHSTSRTTFSGTTSRTLTGVNLGRHTINIGIGGDRKIAKNINLFGDYDLDIGENSISHTGQIGVVKRF